MSAPADGLLDVVLDNGLRVVVASMPRLATATATLQLPLGTVFDPENAQGCSVVVHEWVQRGASDRDAREQADAFDRLGAQRSGGIGRETANLGASFLAVDVDEVLSLLSASVTSPRLDDGEFEGARRLALQELAGLDDAPAERLAEAAVRARYVGPHGRSSYGERVHLERLTPSSAREQARARLVPQGSVLALAGGGDPEVALAVAARRFGGWSGRRQAPPAPVARPPHRRHLGGGGAQTQIALIDGAVPPGSHGWTEQALAMAALSGGMGSRLSTEVRERRGLVYAVSSGVRVLAGDAYRFTYAAATPDRAGAALRVLTAELERLRSGIDADELRRARSLLRSAVVLHSESSAGRAARLAADVHDLGRARRLDEILADIDRVALDGVNGFLAGRPPTAVTVLTSGPATEAELAVA